MGTWIDRPLYRLTGHKGRSRELSYYRAPILNHATPGLYRGGSIRLVRFRRNNRGTRGADWLIYKHGIPQLHLGLAPSIRDAKALLQKELERDAGVYPLPVDHTEQ